MTELHEPDLLRIMYDAQLKKMLAYVSASITSFVGQLTMLYLAAGNFLISHVGAELFITFAFWASQCFFAVAISTKYQELKTLEMKLGISQLRKSVYYPNRPFFARAWDRFPRGSLGMATNDRSRLAKILDVGTAAVLTGVTSLWIYVVWIILSQT
jgi:hypothetical protein